MFARPVTHNHRLLARLTCRESEFIPDHSDDSGVKKLTSNFYKTNETSHGFATTDEVMRANSTKTEFEKVHWNPVKYDLHSVRLTKF